MDIRDRDGIQKLFADVPFDAVIHAAAQPSHDLAALRPLDDFDINAVGTINLLEAARRSRPESVFCFMSTNKVYGDAPNELPLVELETRFDYARPEDYDGIDESCRLDQSMHSVFGASKVAADVMVQEYGRYYGLRTVCFRGGCLTGPGHAGAELHGFLAYLVKCAKQKRPYRVFGYGGKQVRDNIHSYDVCRALERFILSPRDGGAVYNLGGGRETSVSVLEAIEWAQEATGNTMDWKLEPDHRKGDHICYITDLSKFCADYPEWSITRGLEQAIREISEVA